MNIFPLDISAGNIVVGVELVGPSDMKLLYASVDTGATFSIIPIKTVLAIGIDPINAKTRIGFVTASGIAYAPIVTIPTIKAFGFELNNIQVCCHNLPPQSPVEGLLGLNFLKHFNVHLKFRDKILEITK